MTAATPENPLGGQRPRTTGGQPQRVFVNSANIVSRPPVLFRMPAVKVEGGQSAAPATVGSSTQTPSPLAPKSQAANTQAPQPPAPSVSAPTNSLPAPGAVRRPHFMNAPRTSAPQEPTQFTPASIQQESKQLAPVSDTAPRVDYVEARNADFENHPQDLESLQARSARVRVNSIPPIAPLPRSRSWFDVISSRFMVLLIIGVIAAIAIFANREPVPDSRTSLSNLDLNSGELENKVDRSGAEKVAVRPSASKPTANPTTSNPPKSNGTKSSVLPPTLPRAPEQSPAKSIEAVQPSFDLSELAGGTTQSTSMPRQTDAAASQSTNELTPPANALVPPANTNSEPANYAVATADTSIVSTSVPTTAPQLAGPSTSAASTPAEKDWRDELKAMEASVTGGTGTALATPSSPIVSNDPAIATSPMRTNQWASDVPAGVTADKAIRAALDAMAEQPVGALDPSSRSYGPINYRTTAQPNGIQDWSRYLPTNNSPGQPASGGVPQNPGLLGPGVPMNPPAVNNPYSQRAFSYGPGGVEAYPVSQPSGQQNPVAQPGYPVPTNQPFAPQYQLPEPGFGFEGPTGMGFPGQ